MIYQEKEDFPRPPRLSWIATRTNTSYCPTNCPIHQPMSQSPIWRWLYHQNPLRKYILLYETNFFINESVGGHAVFEIAIRFKELFLVKGWRGWGEAFQLTKRGSATRPSGFLVRRDFDLKLTGFSYVTWPLATDGTVAPLNRARNDRSRRIPRRAIIGSFEDRLEK